MRRSNDDSKQPKRRCRAAAAQSMDARHGTVVMRGRRVVRAAAVVPGAAAVRATAVVMRGKRMVRAAAVVPGAATARAVATAAAARAVATARAATLSLALLLLFGGCATTTMTLETNEQFNHRDRRRHTAPILTVTVEEEKQRQTERFVLVSPYLGSGEVLGIVGERSDGGMDLFVTEVRLFGSWPNGWTEGIFEASGRIALVPTVFDGSYQVVIEEPIERWSLKEGAVRYYDTYLIGEAGLRAVQARVDRLEAVAEWLSERGTPDLYGDAYRDGRYGPAMQHDVAARLDAYVEQTADPPPEWLLTLRESGSVDRDLREATPILRTLHNLAHLNQTDFLSAYVEER